MTVRYHDKDNVDAVDFSAGHWTRTETPEGVVYESTNDAASATVRFRPPRADQDHTGCKTGSKFTRRTDGSWAISHES